MSCSYFWHGCSYPWRMPFAAGPGCEDQPGEPRVVVFMTYRTAGISDWSSTNNEVQTYSTKSEFKSKVWDYGICSVYYICIYVIITPMNRSNPPDWSVHPSVHLATRASLSRTFRDEHYEFTFQACDCMILLGLGLWDIRFFERSHRWDFKAGMRILCPFKSQPVA